MKIQHGADSYWTEFFEDRKDGFAGIRLFRDNKGNPAKAAEVVFWDACGGFVIETFGGDIQVEVAEALIAEAKRVICSE